MKNLMSPAFRVKMAWFILVVSVIGWPVSMFTIAKDEPPIVLSLSWLAITITAYDVLSTADVRKEQEK